MISNSCKGELAERGSARPVPVNLLGGYRWPGAGPLDAETRAKIHWAEIAEPRGTSLAQRQTLKNVRDQLADEPSELETRG